jgi:hypothetical protein
VARWLAANRSPAIDKHIGVREGASNDRGHELGFYLRVGLAVIPIPLGKPDFQGAIGVSAASGCVRR